MSRPSYLQEQLLYQQQQLRQRPANINRLRQQALPVHGRSYSLEEHQTAAAAHYVPVYSKFVYPAPPLEHLELQRQLGGLHDSVNSLGSDFTDYDNDDSYIVEQRMAQDSAAPVPGSNVVQNLNALGRFLELLQRWPLPRLSFNTACICSLIIIFIAPRTCAQSLLFPTFRLFFGTLYPAYASYKAVRTKNVKEYVKWMMYWIVFAFFTCIETFTDIFLSWFPFYYEVKVVIVLWLLSPATKGSSTLYRKFVHPMLTRREQEIDEYLNQARERGYSAVLQLGSKGVNYATNVIMQTAIKGGGNLVQTIKRSYSLSDLSEPDVHRTQDELDDVLMTSASSVMMRPQPARLLRQRHQTPVGRSASGTRHSTGMYFTEVDVSAGSAAAGKHAGDFNYNIRSTDDISSGYSSAEPVSAPLVAGLSRTSSMTNASKARVKSKRNELILEEMRSEVYLENERSFELMRAQQSKEVQMQKQFKIVESEEKIAKPTEAKKEMEVEEVGAVVEVDEDRFYEAMDVMEGEELSIATNKDATNKKHMETERLSNNESFKEAPAEKEINVGDYMSESVEIEDYKALVDPFLLVVTESSFDVAVSAGASNTEQPVSPRELLATLEEIKHSFRAQLEPETTPLRPKAQHTKGRAPAPPLPPRRDSRAADSVSLHSTQSLSQLERTKSSGIGHLLKSFKDNMLRKANQQADEEPSVNGGSAKETSI